MKTTFSTETHMYMLQISLYVSKNSKFKFFASLKSSDDYTIAFGRPDVFLNSYSLSHCMLCIFTQPCNSGMGQSF